MKGQETKNEKGGDDKTRNKTRQNSTTAENKDETGRNMDKQDKTRPNETKRSKMF